MGQYNCEVCGQPATVYDTEIENGGAVATRCLCQEHGTGELQAILLRQAADAQDALAKLSQWYGELTDVEKSRLELDYRLSRRRR
jgi:hypothetical protein